MNHAKWRVAVAKTSRLGTLWALCSLVCACSAERASVTDPPSARCASCHLPEFQSTTHPPHPGVRPTTCGVCHGETGWHPARSPFLHSFPLQGGHAKPACFACHTGATPRFEGTTHECAACHRQDRATADAKIAHHDTFSAECDTCHTINAWKPTLPHEAFVEPSDDAEPAAARPSPVPAPKSPGARLTTGKSAPASTARPHTPSGKPWTPDQVSGASPVKQR